MRAPGLVALALLVAALPGAAGAVSIRVSWAGAVELVQPSAEAAMPIETPASGSFSIDTTIADTVADSRSGVYPGAASDIEFRFGDYEYQASTGSIGIMDTLGDAFTLVVGSAGSPLPGAPPIAGISIAAFVFHLETRGPGALASDAIPLAFPFGLFHGGASARPVGGGSLFSTSTTSFSYEVVPEPGPGALVGPGLLALAFARRTRRDA